jgi:predicted O-linked N-acetylglucosamine transferase (SPINDLY family)
MSHSQARASELIDEGNRLEDTGRLGDALQVYEASIALAPNFARAHLNRGNALIGMGHVERAIEAYSHAIACDGMYAAAYFNRGNAFARACAHERAIADYRHAIGLKPDFVDAIVGLGASLEQTGDCAGAVLQYRRAVELCPIYAQVHGNLGDALRALGRYEEAISACAHAVALDPTYVEGHRKLARAYHDAGRSAEAAAAMRRVVDLHPEDPYAWSDMLFYASHDSEMTPARLLEEHRRFGDVVEGPFRGSRPRQRNAPDPSRGIVVGFVSGDLCAHPMAYFIEPLLARLRTSGAIIPVAYSTNAQEDAVTARLRPLFARWNRVSSLSDAELAEAIERDGIDVLVDLSGHTGKHRLLTFARKPAPIAASWMGYLGTTGLRAIDYYLADRYLLPAEQFQPWFVERIVHLPSNAPFLPDPRAPAVNASPAVTNGYVTFGSFNRPGKIGPSVIALWAKLLREVPRSRLIVGGVARVDDDAHVLRSFRAHGVDRHRITVYPHSGMDIYLSRHHEVDVCLDTFPYGGGTTTAHALWMGVPTLTIAGSTPVGRHGVGLLAPLGLQDYVASDASDFIAKARAIANDVPALAKLRAGMRERIAVAHERRPEVIAGAVERALRTMWQRWCAGLAPESFAVSPGDVPVR